MTTKVTDDVPEQSGSANTESSRELAQEAQSEAPSVDSQIDEVFDWLLALYIDTDDAYMVEEMEEDRPIFRAKINRLIAGAEENGILKGVEEVLLRLKQAPPIDWLDAQTWIDGEYERLQDRIKELEGKSTAYS